MAYCIIFSIFRNVRPVGGGRDRVPYTNLEVVARVTGPEGDSSLSPLKEIYTDLLLVFKIITSHPAPPCCAKDDGRGGLNILDLPSPCR